MFSLIDYPDGKAEARSASLSDKVVLYLALHEVSMTSARGWFDGAGMQCARLIAHSAARVRSPS